MKKVLVPLDDSQFSRGILSHVQSLFDPSRYEVILFRAARAPKAILRAGYELSTQRVPRVLGSEYADPMYPPLRDDERTPGFAQQGWQEFEINLKHELAPDLGLLKEAGYTAAVAVHFGDDPAQEIVDFVEREGVNVVAMATHGRTGLGRLLKGSVAEKVLRHLSIPILLLRASEETTDASLKRARGKGRGITEWEQVEADWQEYRVNAKTTWSRLSEAELDLVAGKREQLITKLHEIYGMSLEDAEKEVHNWQMSLELPPGRP